MRRLLSGLALAGLLAGLCGPAAAHPIDEMVQGAYLTLTPGQIGLELDLMPGTEVAAAVLDIIDTDKNAAISGDEARAFGDAVLAQSLVALDGVPLTWSLQDVAMPDYATISGAGDVIKVMATAEQPEAAGKRELTYSNAYAPVKTQTAANIFLRPAGGWQYLVTGQQRPDGQTLTVNYEVTGP